MGSGALAWVDKMIEMKTLYLLAAFAPLAGAIIAAIALTLRGRKDRRSQDPAEQVKARPAERVRLVSMPVEKDQ